MTQQYIRVGRPGAIGSRKEEVLKNYDSLYGKDNWRLTWNVAGNSFSSAAALLLYEDAYHEHFRKNSAELQWISENCHNVYDNNPSNVNSGLDYSIQEFGGNHYQDIAIRRCMVRAGLDFMGEQMLEIRTRGVGKQWSPGELAFHKPELIPQPELKGFWKPGSIESWYQSAKYLEVKENPVPEAELYFATTNAGKFSSALATMPYKIAQVPLQISEEQDSIAKIASHKARVAHSVLCKPVITDDSGFWIQSLNGYPGMRVGRELKEKGIEHFLRLAERPLEAYFAMTLAYMDELEAKPVLFTSRVEGTLIGELRGDLSKSCVKSPLYGCFAPFGSEKTLAEMSPREFERSARSTRWEQLRTFLEERKHQI